MALSYIRPRLWAASSWSRGEQFKWKLSNICRGLVDDAIHEKGCQDNCSGKFVIAALLPSIFSHINIRVLPILAMIIQLQHKDQTPIPLVLG
jgi:hypothetical protein